MLNFTSIKSFHPPHMLQDRHTFSSSVLREGESWIWGLCVRGFQRAKLFGPPVFSPLGPIIQALCACMHSTSTVPVTPGCVSAPPSCNGPYFPTNQQSIYSRYYGGCSHLRKGLCLQRVYMTCTQEAAARNTEYLNYAAQTL